MVERRPKRSSLLKGPLEKIEFTYNQLPTLVQQYQATSSYRRSSLPALIIYKLGYICIYQNANNTAYYNYAIFAGGKKVEKMQRKFISDDIMCSV